MIFLPRQLRDTLDEVHFNNTQDDADKSGSPTKEMDRFFSEKEFYEYPEYLDFGPSVTVSLCPFGIHCQYYLHHRPGPNAPARMLYMHS